ncbi:MAG: FKBP-type peptidyl-prolyl cis-trans isomerase [Hymenobacteraceae bacterium]|nr:FKBP-type peptidyl-prolyl cis-trans isomerase [Hymenobacteraceae bacterium]
MRFRALSASALAALAFAGSLAGCKKTGGTGEFLKTKSGLEYQLFRKDASGEWQPLTVADVSKADTAKQMRPGKVMLLQVVQISPKDSVLLSSYENGMPFPYQTQPGQPITIDTEPMTMLAAGDSGVFRIPTDTIFRKAPPHARPKFLPPGSRLTLKMKVEDIVSLPVAQSRMQQMQEAATKKRDVKDAATLAAYVKEHPELAAAERTPTGVYVLITQAGIGPKPQPGQRVALTYKGSLLSGKEFDASQPDSTFKYLFGQGQVIPGWDQGVAMLSKGAKATILVPSSLGYGMRGAPPRIPANAPLRFDVELKDIMGAPSAQMPMMPPPGALQAR